MRYLVTQMENLLLLAIGFVAGWFVVATLPQQITIASFPTWLIATAIATALLALGGRFVFDGTFQAFGIGLIASSSLAAFIVIYDVVR
jgi:uncharacterized membrane protein YhdT